MDPIINLQFSPVTFWGGGIVVGGGMALFLRFGRGHSVWGAVWRSCVVQVLVLVAYSGIGTTFRAHAYHGLEGRALLVLALMVLAVPAVLLIVACRMFFRPSGRLQASVVPLSDLPSPEPSLTPRTSPPRFQGWFDLLVFVLLITGMAVVVHWLL